MQLSWWITYEIVTYESAEYGDAEERGFIDKQYTQWPLEVCGDEAATLKDECIHTGTLRDIVDAARRYGCRFHPDADWAYSIDPKQDYRTGEFTTYALHLPRNLSARNVDRIFRAVNHAR